MNDHTQSTGHEPAPPPALLPLAVFGRDDAGKAHASRFEATHAALAEKAAGLMGMRVLRLATPEHQTLGAKLPAGRVFESGRAFVPFVKGALFEQLDATAEAFTPARPTDAEVPAPPAPRKAKGARSAQGADKPSGDTEKAAKELAAPPTDPTMIAVGHIVLAAEENALEVWYLADRHRAERPVVAATAMGGRAVRRGAAHRAPPRPPRPAALRHCSHPEMRTKHEHY